MTTDYALVAYFATEAKDRLYGYLTEQGFRVIRYDIRNANKPAISWQDVAFSAVRIRSGEQQSGLNRINMLRSYAPIIAAIDEDNEELSKECLRQGAIAVLNPTSTTQMLDDAIQTAVWRNDVRRQHEQMQQHAKRLATLTPRQRRVIQLASEGATNRRIAARLSLSEQSIERIRREAYQKLDVRSAAEMTRVVILGAMYQSNQDNRQLPTASPTVRGK